MSNVEQPTPTAADLVRVVDRYSAAMYEATDPALGPWPDDPDGGGMRVILALRAALVVCGQAEQSGSVYVPTAVLHAAIRDALNLDRAT